MKSFKRLVCAVTTLCLALCVAPASALDIQYSEESRLSQVTLAGSHNTYDKKGDFEYHFYALDKVQVIELDVWNTAGAWYVSHTNPIGNSNNCPYAGNIGASRNQDLRSCIDGLRKWHDRNPNHELVIVKLEFKSGLSSAASKLDDLLSDISGGGAGARIPEAWIFKPADLMCSNRPQCTSTYASPEAAAKAGNWPKMSQLRGKFMFMMVPGTVSDNAPRRYAAALRGGSARLIFPAVFASADTGAADPRLAYYTGGDTASRPWNVVFDMQAGVLDNGEVPSSTTQWMQQNNFLIFVSNGKPGGDPVNVANGRARLRHLSTTFGANVINTDQEKTGIPYAFDRP